MKYLSIKRLSYVVMVIFFAIAIVLETQTPVNASSGVCDTASDAGVCVGEGAKCNIKKGWLTFRCGKDPGGDSIIIE
jgi:hypothetical protein